MFIISYLLMSIESWSFFFVYFVFLLLFVVQMYVEVYAYHKPVRVVRVAGLSKKQDM